jgi:ATP-dependent DNA helicase RecG
MSSSRQEPSSKNAKPTVENALPPEPHTLSVTTVFGVGSQVEQLLGSLGLRTVEDLLNYAPKRHEDRRHLKPHYEAGENESVTVRGRVFAARQYYRGALPIFEAVISPLEFRSLKDVIKARWFGRYDLLKRLPVGTELFIFGKIKKERAGWSSTPVEFEIVENDSDSYIHMDRLTPIYPLTAGLYARVMRRIMFEATQSMALHIPEFYPAPPDFLSRAEAYKTFHFPDSESSLKKARTRLAYDEFLVLQCLVAKRRAKVVQAIKTRQPRTQDFVAPWLASLPFKPTGAQQRVMEEIAHDLEGTHPMNRLLQGDVGSGKTMVAVYAILTAAERGEQAALMAPTQILAEQHAINLRRWLEPLGLEIQLITGNQKPSRLKRLQSPGSGPDLFAAQAYQKASKGSVIIGTHALLFDRYTAENLGLIVIDEQHKFGVLQRLALSKKGRDPDILVMTATPIPRTLSLTVYGDLDCSTIDELPPGRQQITTVRRSTKELDEFWNYLEKQIGEGRQAYVIYPLIDESEKLEAKSVKAGYEHIKERLIHAKVGLLHGQLTPQEKERTMDEFRRNQIQVLVSTSVIEVGVDVPNANIMLIENAERFGLAQLHQLRGRVGRGEHRSWCVLVGEPKSKESWRRLKIMEETSDGFLIAEEDLEIRGEGNILGTEQSGLPPLRFGKLRSDFDLVHQAREHARRLMEEDPSFEKWPLLKKCLTDHSGADLVSVS